MCLCLCLRQGRFHGEIRITMFALVLASLVRTRLNTARVKVFINTVLFCYGLHDVQSLRLKCQASNYSTLELLRQFSNALPVSTLTGSKSHISLTQVVTSFYFEQLTLMKLSVNGHRNEKGIRQVSNGGENFSFMSISNYGLFSQLIK